MNSVKTHSPGPLCNGEGDTLLNIARPQLEYEALFNNINGLPRYDIGTGAFHYDNNNYQFSDIEIDILTCHDEVYAGTEEDPVGWVVEVGEERVWQEVVVHLGKVLDPDFSKYR